MFLFIFQKDVIFYFSCIDFNCSNGSHGSNYRVGMYVIIRWISCFYAEFNFLCYCIYWQPYILFFCYTNYYCSFCTEEREIGSQKRLYSFIECHSIDISLAYSCNCSDLYEWPYRFHNGWNAIGEYGASSCYEFCCILGL